MSQSRMADVLKRRLRMNTKTQYIPDETPQQVPTLVSEPRKDKSNSSSRPQATPRPTSAMSRKAKKDDYSSSSSSQSEDDNAEWSHEEETHSRETSRERAHDEFASLSESSDEEPIHKSKKRTSKNSQSSSAAVDIPSKSVISQPAPTPTPTPTAPVVAPSAIEDDDHAIKKALYKLIKSTNISCASDVIETSKEIVQQVIEECVRVGGPLSSSDVLGLVNFHFKNGEASLPEEIVIPSAVFERFAKPIFQSKNGSYRRDAMYILHLFVEAYIIKMIQAADMIAASNKRSRVTGADVTVAFHIYNL